MTSYCFYRNRSAEWNVFIPETGPFLKGWSDSMVTTLRGVCSVFEDIFGKAQLSKYPNLSVCYSVDDPVTFSASDLIFLSTTGQFPLQAVYQFAHELCHFVSHRRVCQTYRWLSETLCELMSWYALNWIAEHEKTCYLWSFHGLYELIPGHIEGAQKERTDHGGLSTASIIEKEIVHLQSDWYDRELNREIALGLYPLFLTSPQLWQIVLYLPELTDEMSLCDAVDLLCSNAELSEAMTSKLRTLLLEN